MIAQDTMWVAIGLACLIVAVGIGFVCLRLGGVLNRAESTLGKVERQLDSLKEPITKTVDHVGGIAESADAMVARVARVTEVAEKAAGAVAKTADVAQTKISPALAGVIGVVVGMSEGAKSLFRQRGPNGPAYKEQYKE